MLDRAQRLPFSPIAGFGGLPSMMRAFALFAFAFPVLFVASSHYAVGGTITYNVDFGTTDQADSLPNAPLHLLRVQGTVTFDLDLQDIVSSKLVMTHTGPESLGSLPFYPLTSRPTTSFGRGINWHWLATATELRRITDTNNPNSISPTWVIHVPGGGVGNGAQFSSGPFHAYGYFSFSPEGSNVFDHHEFEWPGASGIGSEGYVFGTAVPEPSTLALAALGAFGLLIAARRKRIAPKSSAERRAGCDRRDSMDLHIAGK